MLKLILPLVALAGAAYAIATVARGSQAAPVAAPVADPSRPPFESYIAGSGLIEAAGQNIAIGSPLPRVIAGVDVQVGDEVPSGAVLFRLDDRDLRADLEVRRALLAQSRARLERLQAAPRAEEVPPAVARVAAAEAALADLRNQVALWEGVADPRAVNVEVLQSRRFAVQAAAARADEAKAALDLLKAGSWKADLAVASADVEAAGAQAKAVEIEIDRLAIRAPMDGVVLQVNVRPGEFAPAGVTSAPLLLFGALPVMHVRVDVDENDAWRFRKGARAVAFVRGNRELKTSLEFVRVEPYVLPKRSLTGDSSERVDTRVMQAVYSFPRNALPVYVGQQMDVFIEETKP